MEIIGRNIPNNTVISSGLESVNSGIQQSTEVQGPVAINAAFDSFAPGEIGTFGAPELLPSIADLGQFPNPVNYFKDVSAPESSSVPKEFLEALTDQNLNANAELKEIAENDLFAQIKSFFQRDVPPEPIIPHPEPAQLTSSNHGSSSPVGYVPVVQGTADQTEAIKNASEKATASYTPKDPEYLNATPSNDGISPGGHSAGEVLNKYLGNLRPAELKGTADQNETINKASTPTNIIQGTADQTETIKRASQYPINDGGVSKDVLDKFPPLNSAMLDAELHQSAKQNESIADETKKAKPSYTPKDPEYLESGYAVSKPEASSASNADQRGIIIVGGKTDGTYFETIDDTLAKMNHNPQPETIQLFQQQVGALQDMSATVQQSVEMNQQLRSATFATRFRP